MADPTTKVARTCPRCGSRDPREMLAGCVDWAHDPFHDYVRDPELCWSTMMFRWTFTIGTILVHRLINSVSCGHCET